tara:strand:+ start:5224 stop:5415 length:192 start_codon:yes stop_codon:yes gene_type:complete
MSHPSDEINTKGHWAVGIQWPVIGSKGDKYTVEMTDKGFECDCPAYRKCKHIKSVEQNWLQEC